MKMKGNKVRNILVANNHLEQIGGSELYTFDLVKAFSLMDNIEVDYFTFNKGFISDKIEEELNVGFMSKKKYDVILASHNTCVKELHKRGYTFQICHGILPGLEEPSSLADYHIGITEEVAEILKLQGFPHKVILNGIDVEEKIPKKAVHQKVKSVLSLCQSDKANKVLREICTENDWDFNHYDKNTNPVFNIADEINESDIVVGIGRSIYDAMACGRPCIIYDNRHYNGSKADGYLRPSRFQEYVKKNCSGRYLNRKYNKFELTRELNKYVPEDGQKLREIVVEKLNVFKVANTLVNAERWLDWKIKLKKVKRHFMT